MSSPTKKMYINKKLIKIDLLIEIKKYIGYNLNIKRYNKLYEVYMNEVEKKIKKKKKELRNNIIYISFFAIFLCVIIIIVSNNISNKYIPDESLYVSYDLSKDLIPAPKQKMISNEKFNVEIRGVNLTVTKLATYDIIGKVEAIKEYNTNMFANVLSLKGENVYDYISPIDLTLSWGQVAKKENSGHIYCDQYTTNTYRAVYIRADNDLINKYGEKELYSQVSNNHIITLNKDLRKILTKVKQNDIVRVVGHLVYVQDSNGGNWGPSSTVRTDTGCEIVWADDIVIMPK